MKRIAARQDGAEAFRPLTAEDFADLNAIYRPYSGRDIAAKRVEEALLLYPSMAATRAGQIIGFCYCFRFAPDIIELANIFVDKSYRQGGLGSVMLQQLLDRIRDPIQAVIAVNSVLNESRELKSSPDGFYARNGFSIVAATQASTVYWWQRPEAGD